MDSFSLPFFILRCPRLTLRCFKICHYRSIWRSHKGERRTKSLPNYSRRTRDYIPRITRHLCYYAFNYSTMGINVLHFLVSHSIIARMQECNKLSFQDWRPRITSNGSTICSGRYRTIIEYDDPRWSENRSH